MRIVAVISPKGGVGKTTVTANLAAELTKSGEHVLALDLDPQNALRLHLGMRHADSAGIARLQKGQSWQDALQSSAFGMSYLPYGTVDEEHREVLEEQIRSDAGWLAQGLGTLDLNEASIVLLDTPPGPSLYMQQVLNVAHIVLVVLKPDAASYSTVPQMESLISYYTERRKDFLGYCVVLNQMDATKQLARDIFSILRSRLKDRFIPTGIHRDESVCEALAYQQPVTEYARHSSAAHDVSQLAAWLQKTYGLID
ncbi:cellulose biosynthesis protein BcsQ [Undibacterium squillarum]|uniref:Cellulose synthase operon protein YhjQ n=1 Tax=Undibacterium squillarum TaxID=1131567 RepID=A0ABQ2Y0V3_9BURK|nr:cellulose biosynthesis protein BcsQ [Undibacterium squillarum]GGX44150.1 hypothetical protein GCM10010946_23380 [Undibacterium squillarum]